MDSTDCVNSTEFIRIMYYKNCFLYVLGLLAAFAYGRTFKTFMLGLTFGTQFNMHFFD